MLAVEVQFNVQPALAMLGDVQRRQVPFAAAVSLTRTAQAAQKQLQGDLPQRFKGRGKLGWVARGVRVEPARKGGTSPFAIVKDIDWFMYYQEAGGEKRPLMAAEMAIPHGESVKRYANMRPSGVVQLPDVFRNRLKNGTEFVGMRGGSERYPFNILYILKPSVQVPARWDFAGTVERVAGERFAVEFEAAMSEAARLAN